MKVINNVSVRLRGCLEDKIALHTLKGASFVVALMSCLTSGSILLFSLMGSNLIRLLSLSYVEINIISSLSGIGMYLCLPILGYLSDVYGPSLLSVLSVVFMVPSYFANVYLIKVDNSTVNMVGLCITFSLIGLGTSSLYFLSLLTCSKIFPEYKGLSISMPVTCYGLSPLIGSQVLKADYFKETRLELGTDMHHGVLNLERVFIFFAGLYLVMGVMNFISSSIVTIEADKLFHYQPMGDEEHRDVNDETTSLLSTEPPNHKARFAKFLRDKSAWLLLATFFLNIGPLEAFQNNLNSILQLLHYNNLADEISEIAFFSTVARLSIGLLADYLSKHAISTYWIMIVLLSIGIINQGLSISYNNPNVIACMDGLLYGGLFTIYPTIVADRWGIEILGSTWGSYMVAPAISSAVFSLIYGVTVDQGKSLSIYFGLVAVSFCASMMIFIVYWKGVPA